MNNEISNKPCGCGNCEPMCTTCGRPWVVCKGECGCNKPCCNKVNFCEYGRAVPGCIRGRAPECPMQAVIPSVVVESVSNLKNLADCFVHVTDINTTFYIDDKHRTSITWAGPVEYDDYDLDANTLGLRSQFLIDFANNRGAYYNKTGNYQIFNFGNGGGEEVVYLVPHYPTDASHNYYDRIKQNIVHDEDDGVDIYVRTYTPHTENISFTNESTGDILSTEEVFNLLEAGTKVVFNDVPLGYGYAAWESSLAPVLIDGLAMPTHTEYTVALDNGSSVMSVYMGTSYVPQSISVPPVSNSLDISTQLSICIYRDVFTSSVDGTVNTSYYLMVEGYWGNRP